MEIELRKKKKKKERKERKESRRKRMRNGEKERKNNKSRKRKRGKKRMDDIKLNSDEGLSIIPQETREKGTQRNHSVHS